MNTLIFRGKKLSRFLKLKQTKTHLILIILSLLTNITLSQNCDCVGEGITVGSPDTPYSITTLSNSDLPPQSYTGCLKVYGTLVITSHYTFDSCQIFMESGAEILVNPTRRLRIDSSIVEGCTTMWKGLHMRNNARLSMNNTIIRDAQYAVYAENYTYLELIDNTFDANYVGVYVPEKPGYSSNKIHFSNDDINGNLFTQQSPYKPAYLGQFPVPGDAPYAGIYIIDAKNITIGKPSNPNVPVKNYFEHLRFGVIFKDCLYSSFYGGRFSQFVYDENQPFLLGGTAIELYDSDRVEIRYCNIEDARTGFFCSENDRITIRNNNIITEEIGLYVLGAKKTTLIHSNDIVSKKDDCIVVGIGESQHPLQIKGNTLTPYLVGIHLDFFDGVLEVENNLIQFVHTDNVAQRHGIACTGLSGSTLIKGNNLIANDSIHTQVKQGIILNLCENTLVKENYISGAKTDSSYWSGGMAVNFSPNNNFCCNSINNSNFGMLFTGACTDTKLANTTFGGKQTVALFLVNSEISPQANTGNDWSLIEEYSTGFSADAWYSGDPTLMGNSMLTVAPEKMPNNYDMVVVPMGEIVEDFVHFGGLDSLCEDQLRCLDDAIKPMIIAGGLGGISTQLADAVNPQLTKDLTSQIFYWEKQKNLYKALYRQPEIRKNYAQFQQFFNHHKNSLIGQFYEIEKGMKGFSSKKFEAEIDFLIEQNAEIQTETQFQENEKIFNNLYLTTLMKGNFELNKKQKLQLQTLILADPNENGTVTWKAQSLANLLNFDIDYPNFDWATIPPTAIETPTKSNQSAFQVFPNPATDFVNIQLQSVNDFANSVKVFDASGKLLISKTNLSEQIDFQLSTTDLLSGFYIIELEWESGEKMQERLIIVR